MKKASQRPIPYAGEEMCSGHLKDRDKTPCRKVAYYRVGANARVYCGRHADADTRIGLRKNPENAVIRERELQQHAHTIHEISTANVILGTLGHVTCHKMRMMRKVPLTPGVLYVFPNNKHKVRSDGYGCASLSPMQLGPVHHQQPGLPPAKSIENYHQFNKCFSNEQTETGEIMDVFYTKRAAAYNDPVPHRHKYPSKVLKKMNKDFVNGVNTPMFSVHLDADGVERRYSYVESRFFYCIWYEKLAAQQPKLAALKQKIAHGVNLCICGYDAYQPTEDLYTHYCDASRPYGHELVLYTLLTVDDPAQYPWRRYYAAHQERYDPLSFDI